MAEGLLDEMVRVADYLGEGLKIGQRDVVESYDCWLAKANQRRCFLYSGKQARYKASTAGYLLIGYFRTLIERIIDCSKS